MLKKKVNDVTKIIALCTLFVYMGTSTGASIGEKNEQKGLARPRPLDEFCLTPACVHTTSKILRSMNPNVEPCNDFHEFACGHYDENTRIPNQLPLVFPALTAQEKVLSRLQSLIEKIDKKTAPPHFQAVKDRYEDCLHASTPLWYDLSVHFQTAVSPVMGANGWPLIYPSNWNEKAFDYAKTFRSLFSLEYRKNVTNNKIYVPELVLQNPFLERHYLKEGLSNYVVQRYFQYMKNIIRLLPVNLTNEAKIDLTETLSTEIELFRDIFTDEIDHDLYRRYRKANLTELSQKYKHLRFPPALQGYPGTEIQMTIDLKTLDKLDQWLATKSKKTLANWAAWRAMVPSFEKLTAATAYQTLHLNSYRMGPVGEENVSKSCIRVTQDGHGFALGALYQRKYIKESSVDEMIAMLNSIKEEMIRFVSQAEWLDAKTKTAALEKVAKMENSLALCRDLISDEELTRYYAALATPGAIPDPTGRAQCGTFFTETQYLSESNFLQFALEMYTEFYDITQPKYLNYGAVGSMMGREISKSLGVKGRYYDIEGNLKPWWDSRSDEMYKARSKCFVDKYGNYKVDGLNISINGLATLPIHVADHTGLKAAHNAYTKLINAGLSEKHLLGLEYSPKQLFWINMAVSQCASYRPEFLKSQVYEGNSVSKFRVNSAVSNLQEFSDDFGCAAGTKMNPVEKCNLW